MLQVPLESPWVRRVRPGGLLLTITCIALLALAAVMTLSFLALAIDKGGSWLGFVIALAFTAGLVFALVLQRRARARILAAVASADLSQPVRADICVR